MLRKSKKSIALLAALMMLATLFVGIPAASAFDTNITSVPNIARNIGTTNGGSVIFNEGGNEQGRRFAGGATYIYMVTINTPGVSFNYTLDGNGNPFVGNDANGILVGSVAHGVEAYGFEGAAGGGTESRTNVANNLAAAPPVGFDIINASATSYTVRVRPAADGYNNQVEFDGPSGIQFDFPLNIQGASPGDDIKVSIVEQSGQLPGGDYVIGKIVGTGTNSSSLDATQIVHVGQDAVFPAANQVAVNRAGTIRIQESVRNTFGAGEVITLDLPEGINWNTNAMLQAGVITGTGVNIGQVVNGQNVGATVETSPSGFSRLRIPLTFEPETIGNNPPAPNPAKIPIAFVDVVPYLDVEDDVNTGDIYVTVAGTTNITTQSFVIAKAGQYESSVERIGDVKEIAAGALNQDLSEFRIIESSDGSLVGNRTIDIELPSYVHWYSTDPVVTVEKGDSTFTVAQGSTGDSNRNVKKITVNATSNRATEARVHRNKVYVDPNAPLGDVEVKIKGSAGLEGTVVLGTIVAPVTAESSATELDSLTIGVAGQKVSDFVVTEFAKESLLANPTIIDWSTGNQPRREAVQTTPNVPGFLLLRAPNGATFSSVPDVAVTSGDLKIETSSARLIEDDRTIQYRVSGTSSTASTLEFSNIYMTLDRTVPVGDFKLTVTGTSLDRTSENNNLRVYDAVVGQVVTPAPTDETRTVTFEMDSTTYYVNGVAYEFDVAPFIDENDRTMIALRAAGVALGVPEDQIYYDEDLATATLVKGDNVVAVQKGSRILKKNGGEIPMDTEAVIINSRMFIPLRFVGQAFGAAFDWDPETRAVTFTI